MFLLFLLGKDGRHVPAATEATQGLVLHGLRPPPEAERPQINLYCPTLRSMFRSTGIIFHESFCTFMEKVGGDLQSWPWSHLVSRRPVTSHRQAAMKRDTAAKDFPA